MSDDNHRVRETGFNDSAERIDRIMQDNNSDYRMVKTWRNKKDSAVRKTDKANHVDMEGQTVLADEEFTLISGAKAKCPGCSGIAAEDCNCRCRASRDIMNDAEFFAVTGRHFDGSTDPDMITVEINISHTARTTEKTVDNSAESGIIELRCDTVALENQRYGRNKDTLVNKTYIDSGEYRRKFDKISDNQNVNKTLYDCAKVALKHRSGTKFEDMYWIDGNTGKIIAQAVNEKYERGIVNLESRNKLLSKYNNIYTIHTHPASMPPSVADFNSAFINGYLCGYIACHNGKIYAYTAQEIISEKLYNLYVGDYMAEGFDEFESQVKALEELKRNYNIDFWEVK